MYIHGASRLDLYITTDRGQTSITRKRAPARNRLRGCTFQVERRTTAPKDFTLCGYNRVQRLGWVTTCTPVHGLSFLAVDPEISCYIKYHRTIEYRFRSFHDFFHGVTPYVSVVHERAAEIAYGGGDGVDHSLGGGGGVLGAEGHDEEFEESERVGDERCLVSIFWGDGDNMEGGVDIEFNIVFMSGGGGHEFGDGGQRVSVLGSFRVEGPKVDAPSSAVQLLSACALQLIAVCTLLVNEEGSGCGAGGGCDDKTEGEEVLDFPMIFFLIFDAQRVGCRGWGAENLRRC